MLDCELRDELEDNDKDHQAGQMQCTLLIQTSLIIKIAVAIESAGTNLSCN